MGCYLLLPSCFNYFQGLWLKRKRCFILRMFHISNCSLGFTHPLFKELILVSGSHETMVEMRKILKSGDVSDLLATNVI